MAIYTQRWRLSHFGCVVFLVAGMPVTFSPTALWAQSLTPERQQIQSSIDGLRYGQASARTSAIRALIQSGKPAIPDVAPLLNDADPDTRVAALTVLGRVGASQVVNEISGKLSDPDARVRAAAAEALGRLADKQATAAVLGALDDPDRLVRMNAMASVAVLDAQAAVHSLLESSRRKSLTDEERQASVLSLGQLRAMAAAPDLRVILTDQAENDRTRAAAAAALGEIGDKSAIMPMVALLGHGSSALRFHTVGSLGRLGGPDAERELIRVLRNTGEEDFVRIRAAWGLGDIRTDAAIQALLAVAREESEFIAMHAVRVLVLKDIPQGHAAVLELKARSQDPFVAATLDGLLAGQR